jgi:hypothetical protein
VSVRLVLWAAIGVIALYGCSKHRSIFLDPGRRSEPSDGSEPAGPPRAPAPSSPGGNAAPQSR